MKKYPKKVELPKRGKQKTMKQKYTKNKKNITKQSSFGLFKFLLYVVLFFLIACFVLMLVLYNKYLKDLPSVSELENLNIAETSIIYDKNGKELYSIYEEKRTYIPFEAISKNMVNAIVAGEDQDFWTNPGFDIPGLVRAGLKYATGQSKLGGTSTLTQQLIRNTIIEKSSSEGLWGGVERKIKEIYLSYKLTKHGSSKEKILELYLNKISYGHNAYGIEEAAKTFFNVQAKDLSVLQASILASLPKGPTFYSPYNYPERVVGAPTIIEKTNNPEQTEIEANLLTQKDLEIHANLVGQLKNFYTSLKGKRVEAADGVMICGINKEILQGNFQVDKDGCASIGYNNMINFISSVEIQNGVQTITYAPGRKDYILQRMLADGYIGFDEYRSALLGSFGMSFNTPKTDINAPHFVFFVREYLEEKYGVEAVAQGGFKVYTTLDMDAQKKAEEIVANGVAKNAANFNAKNAALVSIDNTTGGIVAMVGSADYFNESIKGNVNVITSKLQPGSSFKPFVYSAAMEQSQIGTKTPVYDVATTFPGGYEPGNFDGSFMGKMTVSSALNHSRNIPAIKMYFMAGGRENIITLMKKLGVTSIDETRDFGASMALGTAEMTPLELATAYSVYAHMGEKITINPIVKIVDSKGNVIEDNSQPKKERVISTGQAFLMNYILSETDTRPSSWNKYLALSDRLVAAKTGTSTKPSKTGTGDQRAANLWTIGYTPQYTTVVWAGNTDGEDLYKTANGLEAAGPIWNQFMQYIHSGKQALKWSLPDDIKSIQISEITGYLPGANSDYIVSSYFRNTPTKKDSSFETVEYDALCNGKVTDETPKEAIQKATILEFHSLQPDNPAWENPVLAWAKSSAAIERYGSVGGFTTNVSDEICVRESGKGRLDVTTSLDASKPYRVGPNPIDVAYISESPVDRVEIYINGNLEKTFDNLNETEGGFSDTFFIPARYKNSKVTIELKVVDSLYFSVTKRITVLAIDRNMEIDDDINLDLGGLELVEEEEKQAEVPLEAETPEKNDTLSITLTNPDDGDITIYDGNFFNLRASVVGNASKTEVFVDGVLYKNAGANSSLVVEMNKGGDIAVGNHTVTVRSTSASGASTEKSFNLNILAR